MLQTQIKKARAINGDEGFTLIELLIVIVVLGILAGIVVFGVQNFRGDATTAACKTEVKTVQVAAEGFKANPANTTNTPAADMAALVAAGWLKSTPTIATYATSATAVGGYTVGPATC